MNYRETNMMPAGSMLSSAFGYRDLNLLLEEMFAPGAFPVRAQLQVGDLVLLSAGDGMALAYVQKLDINRQPVLATLLGAPAAPVQDTLKLNRKAA